VPVDQVQLQAKPRRVLLAGLPVNRVSSLPVYTGLPLAPDQEHALRDAWTSGAAARGGPALAAAGSGPVSVEPQAPTAPMWARRTGGAPGFYAPRWRSPEQRNVRQERDLDEQAMDDLRMQEREVREDELRERELRERELA